MKRLERSEQQEICKALRDNINYKRLNYRNHHDHNKDFKDQYDANMLYSWWQEKVWQKLCGGRDFN